MHVLEDCVVSICNRIIKRPGKGIVVTNGVGHVVEIMHVHVLLERDHGGFKLGRTQRLGGHKFKGINHLYTRFRWAQM